MGNFAKDNEALYVESMTPMMVMISLHSFTPCIDSNNHLEDHDITSSSESTADSNTEQLTDREDHAFLQVEETHIGLISDNGKSPYYDMVEDQQGDQYSSCIILKVFSWLELKNVQMVNDMKNETLLKFAISQHNQTSLNFAARINIDAPLLPRSFTVER